MSKTQPDNFTSDLFSDTKDDIPKNVIQPINNGIVTFGKYKGKLISEMSNDYKYCNWLLSQSWFKENYYPIYIVINNYYPTKDTPEHNRLQVLFTDEIYSLAMAKLCNWKIMTNKRCIRNIEKALKILKQNNYSSYKNNFDKIEDLNLHLDEMKKISYIKNGIEYSSYSGKPLFRLITKFEQEGWDVLIQNDDENDDSTNCKVDCPAYDYCSINSDKIAVELKPTLGDDYSTVLRQIKNFPIKPDYQCLVYEKFTSVVATLEHIKSIFAPDNIKIFSLAELEKARQEIIFLRDQLKENFIQST